MSFSEALKILKSGQKVRRSMFGGGVFLQLIRGEGDTIMLVSPDGTSHYWIPSQDAILAFDWSVVK